MDLKRIGTLTILGCIALVAVGCSSDSDSASTTSTTPRDAVCADKDKLETSVKALTDEDLLTSGTSGIKSALEQVQTNLDALATSAQADLKPQVDKVKSSVEDLQTAVGNVGDGSLTDNLQAIGDAVSSVGSTAGDLFSSLQSRCPSS